MDDSRRNAIAIALLKQIFRERGFYLHSSFRQEFNNTIAALGVAEGDMPELAEVIVREFIEQDFADPEHSDVPLGRIVDTYAKAISVPESELAEFIRELVTDLVHEAISGGM